MNFYISYPGRLCNQLILLYHIYDSFESIDKIYAPRLDPYQSYFKIDERNILCGFDFFKDNKDSFEHISWEAQGKLSTDLFNPKFEGLKLKDCYLDRVMKIRGNFGDVPLVAVHIRQGDYADFCDGKYFFNIEHYLKITEQKIKDWDLKDYLVLLFSDIILNIQDLSKGIVVSRLTDNIAALDLFLMSQCNYFIHTWSTFSALALQLSVCSGKFKDNYLIIKETPK